MCTLFVRLLARARLLDFEHLLFSLLGTQSIDETITILFVNVCSIYLFMILVYSIFFLYIGGLNAFAVIKTHFFYIWSILVSLLRCLYTYYLNTLISKMKKKTCSNLNWSNFIFVYLCYFDLISDLLKFHLNISYSKDDRKKAMIKTTNRFDWMNFVAQKYR